MQRNTFLNSLHKEEFKNAVYPPPGCFEKEFPNANQFFVRKTGAASSAANAWIPYWPPSSTQIQFEEIQRMDNHGINFIIMTLFTSEKGETRTLI